MSLAARLLPVIAARRRLSVGLSGASANAAAVGNGPFTTNAVTAIPAGGVAPYAYAWARVSGDATISVSSASAAAPTWSASGTAPATKGAVWRCTVTDATGVAVVTTDVTISVQFQVAGLSVSVDTTTLSASGSGNGPFVTGAVTATPVGGVGPFTHLWERVSGDTSYGPSDTAAAVVTFTASGTAPETKNSIWRDKVTDSLGTIAYSAEVSVAHTFSVPALSVALDTDYAYGVRIGTGSGEAQTNTVTATPSGGQAPYTHAWEYVSGDSVTTVAPTAAATQWRRTAAPTAFFTGYYRDKVTDNLGTVAYSANVQVNLEFDSGL